MYDIYYNLKKFGSDGHTFESSATTEIKACSDAVQELRRVLKTLKVEILSVGEMEFVIWAYRWPQGYLSIKLVGSKT